MLEIQTFRSQAKARTHAADEGDLPSAKEAAERERALFWEINLETIEDLL